MDAPGTAAQANSGSGGGGGSGPVSPPASSVLVDSLVVPVIVLIAYPS